MSVEIFDPKANKSDAPKPETAAVEATEVAAPKEVKEEGFQLPNNIDVTYQVVTNLSCNLDCEYCYERKYPRNNDIEACVDFIHACFDRDRNKPNIGGAIIDIIGGEPMLQPKLLIAIFETAEMLAKRDNRPYVFSISTNGTLFNKRINQKIVERWADKLSIGVSIDGLPESHDQYRIYTSTGKGSYEDAVAGYNYLKSMNIRELGVKATFTLATLPYYAAGMKSLIDVTGGGTINGNLIYEDVIPRGMAPEISNQMIEVIDYWCEKGLHLDKRNTLGQITPHGFSADAVWNPIRREQLQASEELRLDPERVRPFCGTVKYMTCLGFDRKIYGCNRFMSTVTTRQAIGELVGREIIPLDRSLETEIDEQWKDFSDTCLKCPAKHMCASCAAAPYENKDGSREARKEYHSERRQCGWTMAKLLTAQYWYEKFESYDDQYVNLCMCPSCRSQRGE